MTPIPNFADVPLRPESDRPTLDAWRTAAGPDADRLNWQTPEQIPVRPLYTAADLDGPHEP